MTRPYRPSNGTEGTEFICTWCEKCKRDAAARDGRPEDGCQILSDSFFKEVHEWVYDPDTYFKDWKTGAPRCTAFEPVGGADDQA